MKSYELTCVIPLGLSEENLKSLQEKVISLIQQEGVFIESGTKRTSQILMVLNFQMKASALENFKQKLNQEREILRYMILTKSPTASNRERTTERRTFISRRKTTEDKVAIGQIEKKLEEILK